MAGSTKDANASEPPGSTLFCPQKRSGGTLSAIPEGNKEEPCDNKKVNKKSCKTLCGSLANGPSVILRCCNLGDASDPCHTE